MSDVAILMGSDSDWPTMQAAAEALEEFGVSYRADVVSAHRMPEEMIAFGRSAHEQGFKVIIAGAGGAAHLPGMLAAMTPLPVIGVPVATVAVGNARNAGLLAVRILAAGDEKLRAQMVQFQASLRDLARAKGEAVRRASSGN